MFTYEKIKEAGRFKQRSERWPKFNGQTVKKETIAKLDQQNLSDLKGGYTTSTVCGNPTTETVACLTRGNCDIPTIGHDDGPNCLSKSDSWCWCYGI